MKRYLLLGLLSIIWTVVGCESSNPTVPDVFRGNAISQLPADGVLRAGGSPYLAVDTLRVPAGKTLTIEPGVELRFDSGIPMEIKGKIIARGTAATPIIFTSGAVYPGRGDWDGIHLTNADPSSVFEYCKFLYGAKYGRRYYERIVAGEQEKAVIEYGALTLNQSSPLIKRCSFLDNGFHGLHIDSLSNPTVQSSFFYNNAGHGLYVHYTAKPIIRYNIVMENDDYGLFCKQPTDSPRDTITFDYNIVWSNFSGEYNGQAPRDLGRITDVNDNLDNCDARHNLRSDPLFKDPLKWDFNLRSGSAAIDAGPQDVSMVDGDGTRIELGLLPYNYRDGEIRRSIPNLPRIGNTLQAGKTYIMSYDLILPKGQTLTIEPGVTIKVEGSYQFLIRGKILANGTAAAPIKFVSAPNDLTSGLPIEPKRGDWVGLIFEAGGDDGSKLTYTTVAFARNGLYLNRRDAEINYCTFSDNERIGVWCDDLSSPVITNSTFIDNPIAGILCQYNSSPKILRNRINGGAGYGIYAVQNSNPEIYNNLITTIGTTGIRLENLSSPEIINNTITSSGYYGINCESNCDPVIKNNIFTENGARGLGGFAIMGQSTSIPEIKYNCFYKHSRGAVKLSLVVVTPDATNLGADNTGVGVDPQFMDASKNDYRLKASSPCKTKGDPAVGLEMGAFGGPNPLQ